MLITPSEISNIPSNPGVYKMLDINSNIIYIGKAKNLKKRVFSYFDTSAKSQRILKMTSHIKQIELFITNSEEDALVLEQKLINKIKPKYNIIFRDDKSYPFISISNHKFPQIKVIRDTKKFKGKLFGPYPHSSDARKNIEFIESTFKLRSCEDFQLNNRSRPCILYDIGKCSAPCMNLNNTEFQKKYEEQVNLSVQILNGNVKSTIDILNKKMNDESMALEFEKAAKTRDTIKHLDNFKEKQTIYSIKNESVLVFNYINKNPILLGFMKVLDGIPQKIMHIKITGEMLENDIQELLEKYIESNYQKGMKILSPIELPNLFFKYKNSHFSEQEHSWLNTVHQNLELIQNNILNKQINNKDTNDKLNYIFNKDINTIDFLDISHFSGEATYGGKIRWSLSDAKLDKKGFRLTRFDDLKIDDIYHIKNSVLKMYQKKDIPSLLIIDGDIAQLNAAYEALEKLQLENDVLLMSSAKGEKRQKGKELFYIHENYLSLVKKEYLNNNILILNTTDNVRMLFQNLQDKAHEFANSARIKKMSKTRFDIKKEKTK